MRTTLTIEDRIARDLKRIAQRSGKPFKVVVNETLQAGLSSEKEQRKPRRYRLHAVSLGAAGKGIDLDKALALADTLEDQELIRRMDLRK